MTESLHPPPPPFSSLSCSLSLHFILFKHDTLLLQRPRLFALERERERGEAARLALFSFLSLYVCLIVLIAPPPIRPRISSHFHAIKVFPLSLSVAFWGASYLMRPSPIVLRAISFNHHH